MRCAGGLCLHPGWQVWRGGGDGQVGKQAVSTGRVSGEGCCGFDCMALVL